MVGRTLSLDNQPLEAFKRHQPISDQAGNYVQSRPAGLGRLSRTSWQELIAVTGSGQTGSMSPPDDDPVPPGLVLNLEEAFRVLEALEDALHAIEEAGVVPGLRDELATVIRLIHGRLGLDEGDVL